MSTLKVTNIQDTAGANSATTTQIYNGIAKAWVNFDGTFGTSPLTVANGGIRAAFNVSSVTDNGTGDYTVNFTTALGDANYSAVVTVDRSVYTIASGYTRDDLLARTASGVRIGASGTILGITGIVDSSVMSVAIFR